VIDELGLGFGVGIWLDNYTLIFVFTPAHPRHPSLPLAHPNHLPHDRLDLTTCHTTKALCMGCQRLLGREEYSEWQWRHKHTNKPRCKTCYTPTQVNPSSPLTLARPRAPSRHPPVTLTACHTIQAQDAKSGKGSKRKRHACVECGVEKDRDEYTRRRWNDRNKAKNGVRCNDCVEASK